MNESKKKNEATPTDRLQRDAYRRRISDKNNWFEKADDLLHAASFLKPEVEKIYGVWKNQLGISSELPDDGDQPKLRSFEKASSLKCV